MTDYTGRSFGNYRLLRLLGKGSFAEVYLGKHLYLRAEAAIKILYGRLDADAIEQFFTEARLLLDLEHPHIIRVHNASMVEDIPYLVMDYAPGGTLGERHPKGSSLPLATILSYVQPIASALDYAHEHRLIHRDVKPENLLLDSDERVLLSDFGVAMAMRGTDSMSMQTVRGTLAYMAPEQIRGRPCAASDQYALGIMVYEWLAGRRPFVGDVADLFGQHLFVAPPSLSEMLPHLPSQVEQVIFKALAKEPEERFASVGVFADALSDASQGKDIAEHLLRMPEPITMSIREAPRLARSPKLRLNNLPTQLTRLIGRERERETACVQLVRPEVRLLNMTGPGGIGKTSLALAVATDVQHAFADGICYVVLSAVSDPDLVLPTVLQALGIKGMADSSTLTTVTDFLREKHLLLVLDNFEQVIDAAPIILELLQTCPDLTMLVTSRIVLHVPGEQTLPVPPLALPNPREKTEQLSQVASVALFLERAQACQPEFRLTPTNARVVAAICARLDGLPLAVELAAARIKIMTPQTLLSRLSRRLDLLSVTTSPAPARQHTVRKTIQWSYDLLTDAERVLFRRLAVFVGGCQMSDVEALYELLGDDFFSVMDGVSSLVDKSLIYLIRSEEDEPRLLMLETMREFGLEQLGALGELELVRAAHASYYPSLAPEIPAGIIGAPEGAWIEHVQREYANMLAALQWLQDHHEFEKELRFAQSLGGLWMISGYRSTGVALLTGALDLAREKGIEIAPPIKALALLHAGRTAMYVPDPLQASPLLRECIELLRQLEDHRNLPFALLCLSLTEHDLGHNNLSDTLFEEGYSLLHQIGERRLLPRMLAKWTASKFYRGEWVQARELCERCLTVAREFKDSWMTAFGLHFLGWIAYCQGAYTTARASGEEAVSLFRELNFPTWGLEALCVLAYETAALGEDKAAQVLFEEALSRSEEAGEVAESAHALCGLGWVTLSRGNLEQTQQLLTESITLMQRLKVVTTRHKHILACALEGLAQIALSQGNATWMVYLLSAADTQRSNEQYTNPVGLQKQMYESVQAEARFALGESAFVQSSEVGRQMTPIQALMARNPVENAQMPDGSQSTGLPKMSSFLPTTAQETMPADSLTKREMDVLRLLAEGQSNAEIADHLVLSIVTVNSYLRSIYSKLGVSSRMRAVRYAMEHNLLS